MSPIKRALRKPLKVRVQGADRTSRTDHQWTARYFKDSKKPPSPGYTLHTLGLLKVITECLLKLAGELADIKAVILGPIVGDF